MENIKNIFTSQPAKVAGTVFAISTGSLLCSLAAQCEMKRSKLKYKNISYKQIITEESKIIAKNLIIKTLPICAVLATITYFHKLDHKYIWAPTSLALLGATGFSLSNANEAADNYVALPNENITYNAWKHRALEFLYFFPDHFHYITGCYAVPLFLFYSQYFKR